MRKKYLIIYLLLVKITFAQIEIFSPQPIDDKFYIQKLIQNLSIAFKSNNLELLNKLTLYEENKTNNNTSRDKSVITIKSNLTNINDIQIQLEKILSLTTLSAKVTINLYLFSSENFEKFIVELSLIKKDGAWFIEKDPKNFKLLESILENRLIRKETENKKSFQIRYSNSTLIQAKYYSSPDIWELNKNVTNQYIQRDLFATNSELDVELYVFGNNWLNDVAAFILDPVWERIIYTKKIQML